MYVLCECVRASVHLCMCLSVCPSVFLNCVRERHSNGDGGNTPVTVVILQIFLVNLAVIPRGWSNLLRGYHGIVCDNTATANV